MSVWGSKKDTIARLTAIPDPLPSDKKKKPKLKLVFTEQRVIQSDNAESALSELRQQRKQAEIDDDSKDDDSDLKTDASHDELVASGSTEESVILLTKSIPETEKEEEETKEDSSSTVSKSDESSNLLSSVTKSIAESGKKKTLKKKKKTTSSSKVMGHSGSRYEEVISVILDSGVFITRCNVANYFNPAKTNFYITENVRREVSDARSMEFLTSFPFKLDVIAPKRESWNQVNEWIKILPEYNRTLSRTDKELIALTLEHTLNDDESRDCVKDIKEFAKQLKSTRDSALQSSTIKSKASQTKGKKSSKFGVTHLDAWDGEWATPENYQSISESGVDKKRKRIIKETMRSISDVKCESKVGDDATTDDNHDGLDGGKSDSSKSRIVCITVDVRMQQLMTDMGLRIMSVSSDRLTKMSDSTSRAYKPGEVLIEQMIECQICKHKYSDMNMSRVYCTANCGCDELWIIKKYLQYDTGRIRLYKRKLHSARKMKQLERKKDFDQRQRRKIYGKQRHKKHTSTARGIGPARKRSNKLRTAGAGKRETLSHDMYPKRGL